MVYGVDRTVPGERGSEVVIETASRAKAYRLKNKLQKLDSEAVYGTSMLIGSSAGEYDEGPAEGFEEYISETVRKILG